MDLEKPRPDDHEAKMARADCYKLAEYSAKLFQMIKEGEELDGWVQAKITKAADYISSVYHYLEYEKMSRESINLGPREFEEAVQAKVKDSLAEQWLNKKQGN
jgi:benzoyl-CoA reductase/2-hydroxyglutaryl-CoA dehydratase subunit BcrC/BadD/HgdB